MKLSFIWIVGCLGPGCTANKVSKYDVVELEKVFEDGHPDFITDMHRRLEATYLDSCDELLGAESCCNFDPGSWGGQNGCYYVGENFEVGIGSCQLSTSGSQPYPCSYTAANGGSAKIGRYSCINRSSCHDVGRYNGNAIIKDYSCAGNRSGESESNQCRGVAENGYAYIGSNSCQGIDVPYSSCAYAGHDGGNVTILDGSCLGGNACGYAGGKGHAFIDEGSCGTNPEDNFASCNYIGYGGKENTFARIGKSSCHGSGACGSVAMGGGNVMIGDNSCLGQSMCHAVGNEGGNVVIHDNSCHTSNHAHNGHSCSNVGQYAYVGGAEERGSVIVMRGSCTGESACMSLGSSVTNVRFPATATVGENACKGPFACHNAGRQGVAIIGDGSCIATDDASNDDGMCRMIGGENSHFEVGSGSCKDGIRACQTFNNAQFHIVIGDSSCFGGSSCWFDSNPNSVTIGSGSCQCESCCKCLGEGASVPDNKCNERGTGPNSCCTLEYEINPDFDSSGLITPPTSPTRSLTTDPPTTIFQGQNFTIGRPQSSFVDTNGNFSIEFDYSSLGESIDLLVAELRYQNCSTPYVETDQVISLPVPITPFKPIVLIDTKLFSSSSLIIGKSLNESIGVLAFCMRVDGLSADGTSVSYRNDEINLSFDLSSNAFEVTNNGIEADDVLTSENNVTTSYSVTAFRCSADGFEDIGTGTQLTQNEVVHICLEPVNDGVFISAFTMGFYQDTTEMKYEAVRIDGWVNPLSQVSSNEKTKKVASRVISRFFDGDANPFSVEGNAFLSFDTSRSRLLRSIQERNKAGETPFTMDVKLEKGAISTNMKESNIKGHAAMSVIGGLLILSIAFVVLKKIK